MVASRKDLVDVSMMIFLSVRSVYCSAKMPCMHKLFNARSTAFDVENAPRLTASASNVRIPLQKGSDQPACTCVVRTYDLPLLVLPVLPPKPVLVFAVAPNPPPPPPLPNAPVVLVVLPPNKPPPPDVAAGAPNAGLGCPNPPKPPAVAVFEPKSDPLVVVLVPKPPLPPVFEAPKPAKPVEPELLLLLPKPKDMAAIDGGRRGRKRWRARAGGEGRGLYALEATLSEAIRQASSLLPGEAFTSDVSRKGVL